jgi:cell wall assembly regulator SMI1
MNETAVREYRTRLENWLYVHAPQALSLLHPGATRNDIASLELIIGKELPADFVQFYLICNGQNEEKGLQGLIDSEELLSIGNIIYQSRLWKELLDSRVFEDENGPFTSEPDRGIKNDWWNPLWIPFTHDGSGNHICIDLDPAPGGHVGQVIRMWHDSAGRELYAGSFSDYMGNYITRVEAGEFVYVEKWGLVHKSSPLNQ